MTATGGLPRFPPPAPLLLAIETAGSGCSATILRGSEILAAERRPLRHGHAEVLLPMIDRVASAAGSEPGELRFVAAATGPGGFTGIRAGLAAAHGIALAAGARLIGITCFAAVAAASRGRGFGRRPRQSAVKADDAPRLLIALDSRRAEFYIQAFAEDHATPLAEPVSIPPDRLHAYVAGLIGGGASLLIAGDMAERAADALGTDRRIDIVPDSAPDALGVATAALFGLGSDAAPATVNAPVRPFYLRSPDVTPQTAKTLEPVAGL